MAGLAIRKTAALPLAGALALGSVSPATASTLAPTGEWQSEQAAESCRIWRDFGQGAARTTFNIYAYGPDNSFRIVVTGPQVPRDDRKSRVVTIQFGEDREPEEAIALVSSAGEEGMVSILTGQVGRADHFLRGFSIVGNARAYFPLPEDMTSFSFDSGSTEAVTLSLGSMGAAMAMLRNCQGRLAASWGLSPQALAPDTSPPVLQDQEAVFLRLSMPESSVLNHVTISAQIRVMVDAQGRVQSCLVQTPPLDRRQQRGLCGPLTREAEFTPARDAEGTPVAGVYRLVYTYFIFD